MILSLASLGVGDNEQARDCAMKALSLGAENWDPIWGGGWLVFCLQCNTLVMVTDAVSVDDRVKSAQMLGLIFNHPASPRKYFEHDPLLTRLRQELETELGAEAYAAAWARGQALDLGDMVNELLAESQD